jgi:hypothetical protein
VNHINNSNVYYVKTDCQEKIEKLDKNKGKNPIRKYLIALLGTLMNILF